MNKSFFQRTNSDSSEGSVSQPLDGSAPNSPQGSVSQSSGGLALNSPQGSGSGSAKADLVGKGAEQQASSKDSRITPSMAQYLRVKKDYPDALVFYRMGDFYELFFEDAVKAAAVLDIALTKRGKHQGKDIPMCGVPHHAYDRYLVKLVKAGFKVAITEQLDEGTSEGEGVDEGATEEGRVEAPLQGDLGQGALGEISTPPQTQSQSPQEPPSPQSPPQSPPPTPLQAKPVPAPQNAQGKRGDKLKKREVVRLVTAGTLTEDAMLPSYGNNWLVGLALVKKECGFCYLDISTGEFFTKQVSDVMEALASINPSEVIVKEGEFEELTKDSPYTITRLPAGYFAEGTERLAGYYKVKDLKGIGSFSEAQLAAATALLEYVELTQKGKIPHVLPLREISRDSVMVMDASVLRNLEIFADLNGKKANSLFAVLDRTKTSCGKRMLATRLVAPLVDVAAINARLDGVEWLLGEGEGSGSRVLEDICELLGFVGDIERAVGRISLYRGTAADLLLIREGIGIGEKLATVVLKNAPKELTAFAKPAGLLAELKKLLLRAISAEPSEGNTIQRGYHSVLDEIRHTKLESKRLVAELEAKYRQLSGIASLKIKYSEALGGYIEVSAVNGDRLAKDPMFIHRRTMKQAVRFTTEELNQLMYKIGNADERILAIEQEILRQLSEQVAHKADLLSALGEGLARLDVAASTAKVARQHSYTRPILDEGLEVVIKDGRHPMVEGKMEFVPNDLELSSEANFWLITGPNMAGKSTFLRQNALMVLMAQAGFYVPASEVRVGIVTRLFSRIGAGDDLAGGRSTFMVEMSEAATILNNGDERSFVIIDEVGRGTASKDGLSIAQAIAEHIHDTIKCRTLFATHYGELAGLAGRLQRFAVYTMEVKLWQNVPRFLYKIAKGKAENSWGVHVASLAGIPNKVVKRALELLKKNAG